MSERFIQITADLLIGNAYGKKSEIYTLYFTLIKAIKTRGLLCMRIRKHLRENNKRTGINTKDNNWHCI